MNPIMDLLDQQQTVLFEYHGHDHEPDGISIPLFISIEKREKNLSICVNRNDINKFLDENIKEIHLDDTVFNPQGLKSTDDIPPDADRSLRTIRIRRRAKVFCEDGGRIEHLELTLVKGESEMIQALVSCAQVQNEMKGLNALIQSRITSAIAA